MWKFPASPASSSLIPVSRYAHFIAENPETLLSRVRSKVFDRDLSDGKSLYTGSVKKDSFRITKKLHKPEFFQPEIQGDIETLRNGCLLRLTYRLVGSTRFFLILWSGLSLLMALLFMLAGNYVYGLISVIFALGNYTVVLLNFFHQSKKSNEQLMDILTNS